MLLEQPLAVSELHVGSFKTNRLVSDQSSRQCPCNYLNPQPTCSSKEKFGYLGVIKCSQQARLLDRVQ